MEHLPTITSIHHLFSDVGSGVETLVVCVREDNNHLPLILCDGCIVDILELKRVFRQIHGLVPYKLAAAWRLWWSGTKVLVGCIANQVFQLLMIFRLDHYIVPWLAGVMIIQGICRIFPKLHGEHSARVRREVENGLIDPTLSGW